MAGRRANPKCRNCATLCFEDMLSKHGAQGDNCYAGDSCHKRRSYYKNRSARLAYQKSSYQRKRRSAKQTGVPMIGGKESSNYTAHVVRYQSRKNAPVYAVCLQIFQSGKLIETVWPTGNEGQVVSTLGKPQSELRAWVKSAMILKSQPSEYAGLRLTKEVYEPVAMCPKFEEMQV